VHGVRGQSARRERLARLEPHPHFAQHGAAPLRHEPTGDVPRVVAADVVNPRHPYAVDALEPK